MSRIVKFSENFCAVDNNNNIKLFEDEDFRLHYINENNSFNDEIYKHLYLHLNNITKHLTNILCVF